ncbi:hypothetical protein [Acidithiobacillus ferrooxidans]|uniref:hypothetical protein n=1 Tax=Acidithiobacillus ferrooxidans TaxID=920 RepID=UPI000A99EF9F|nr:hypothetical protein [Acidithiobacillus ferrooxidans]MCL5956552.1 hypothetical protein [Gammaproteobacteria bacterium]MCR0970172.1 hypothetical protein [Acidithiobacillus ferrooxidans]QLK42245.1 hypothetical protein FE661_08770 [Acidithiobacillus ferrooxidans]QZT51311.1 hypothetical protein K7B00_08760 [Acidithiobacillus ferrooxidans]
MFKEFWKEASNTEMPRISRSFPLIALLALFLLGAWMSNAAVGMPSCLSCAAVTGMSATGPACCRNDRAADINTHSRAAQGQCMLICAGAHASDGLKLPEMTSPAQVTTGFVTFSRLVIFRPARYPIFFSHHIHHPPPLHRVRLVI